jgi:hypothetical protein
MAKINYTALVSEYAGRGSRTAGANLREAFSSGDIRPDDFDLGALAAELIGWDRFRECRNGGSLHEAFWEASQGRVTEAGTAVTAAQFSNITGQLVFAKVMEGFRSEEFVFTPLVETIPTRSPNGERIPGIGGIGDDAEVVGEGNAFPLVGLNEDYIETPAPVKRGFICPVTREAVLFDRTGLVLRRAAEVGLYLGLNKEKRIIDCIVDENTTAHRYKWRGTVIQTYDDNTGNHTWDNLQAANALVDWTDIDNAEQLLNGITDPNTGEPVVVQATDLVCTKQLEYTALRIRNATEITVTTPGYATSGNPTETRVANPLGGRFEVRTSRLLAARMATDTSWFYGNLRRAFAYMEVLPLEVQQAPANSEAEFTQDIVQRYRAVEFGAAATLEPRFVIKSTA